MRASLLAAAPVLQEHLATYLRALASLRERSILLGASKGRSRGLSMVEVTVLGIGVARML